MGPNLGFAIETGVALKHLCCRAHVTMTAAEQWLRDRNKTRHEIGLVADTLKKIPCLDKELFQEYSFNFFFKEFFSVHTTHSRLHDTFTVERKIGISRPNMLKILINW